MASAFVSHSSKDRYFVDLLVSILEFHDVHTWCSPKNLVAGVRFRSELADALADAEALIVVVSANSASSNWVIKEVAEFQAKKPDARLVPLLLDDTNPDQVIDRLSDYQALNFAHNMLEGFTGLVAMFGKPFLPRLEKRQRTERRKDDRRNVTDRRASRLVQRMRIGYWKAFAPASGLDKFEPLRLGVNEMFKTIEALSNEAAKYEFYDSHDRCVPHRDALEASAQTVWHDWRAREIVKAIYCIEAIAEHMYANYRVTPKRRRGGQTRGNAERRSRSTRSR